MSIQNLIKLKNSFYPLNLSSDVVKNITSEIDHYPYTQMYRSTPDQLKMFSREAGYSERRDYAYMNIVQVRKTNDPDHCFQGACNVPKMCHCDITSQFGMRQ